MASRPTLFIQHPRCLQHDMGPDHPESADRLRAIEKHIKQSQWGNALLFKEAPKIERDWLSRIHPKNHIKALMERSPTSGFTELDADTRLNPHSIDAALYAVGAAIDATDEVIAGHAKNAFCAVRPPGHHAESAIAMGFCLFNSVALAAERALSKGMKRVAILDFDVHHGNGTVEIFQDRPEVLVCSSFQHPFYPGRFDTVQLPNICLTPLPAGTNGPEYHAAIETQWTKALLAHQPEMIFISAGFDAHKDDPLGGLNLEDHDYLHLTQFIQDLAMQTAEGRIVSLLEGGYHLDALGRSVVKHIQGLI